jgi:hypothetical protein
MYIGYILFLSLLGKCAVDITKKKGTEKRRRQEHYYWTRYADPIGLLLCKRKADDWEREKVIGCESLMEKYVHGGY